MSHLKSFAAAAALSSGILFATAVAAADLPAVTTEMLKELKLGAEVLDGIDKELALPPSVIQAARKEGRVRVDLTIFPKEFEQILRVFKTRYPGIEVDYQRAVGRDRAMAPLVAFNAGNLIVDVASAFNSMMDRYRSAGATIDLRDLPTFEKMPEALREKDGIAAPYFVSYWCVGYNKNKVKKEELPNTWEELLKDTRWHNGRIGALNYPHLWLGNLWGLNGDEWTDDYMKRFFTVVKPQRRKEAATAALKLSSVGEFDMVLPVLDALVATQQRTGAPVDFHCPDPAPVDGGVLGIMKGSPSESAAKVFVNWLMSKEGQLTLFRYSGYSPAHTELASLALSPFSEAVKGKTIALRSHRVNEHLPKIQVKWNEYWGRF